MFYSKIYVANRTTGLQELSRKTQVVATNGSKMAAVVVLAHALRYFGEQALREVSEQSATPLSNDDVRWVVTVPAIWTAAAKQLMRQAAYDVSRDSVQSPAHTMPVYRVGQNKVSVVFRVVTS